MIVEAALQEDVDVIGLSILSGAHMTLLPKISRPPARAGHGRCAGRCGAGSSPTPTPRCSRSSTASRRSPRAGRADATRSSTSSAAPSASALPPSYSGNRYAGELTVCEALGIANPDEPAIVRPRVGPLSAAPITSAVAEGLVSSAAADGSPCGRCRMSARGALPRAGSAGRSSPQDTAGPEQKLK